MQFDEDVRGFSFQKDGPLDMRMDPNGDLTAKDVVNGFSQKDLEALFREFGEERFSKKGAKAIVEARKKKPFCTTKQLSSFLEKVLPKKGKRHVATKIFQAIRIYVNKELESIEGALKKAIQMLSPKGVLGVISFHSLEDRIVKNIFRQASKPLEGAAPLVSLLMKKPKVSSDEERRKNKRSRSAKLRFAIKL